MFGDNTVDGRYPAITTQHVTVTHHGSMGRTVDFLLPNLIDPTKTKTIIHVGK